MSDPKAFVLSLPACLGEAPREVQDHVRSIFPDDQCRPVDCIGADNSNPAVQCRVVFLCTPDFTPDLTNLPEGWSVEQANLSTRVVSGRDLFSAILSAIEQASEEHEHQYAQLPVVRNVNDRGMLN